MQRFPRTVVVLTVALLFGGGGLMMHAEQQAQVLALLAGFIVVFALADRTAFGREVSAICSDYGGFANTTALVCALAVVTAFRNEHYTLLMLSTVALFATACIGLNLQLAFAGIANFAGAAFFVIGSYTAAVLTAYAALPHLLILAVGGIVAGAVGVILLLPVLRTRGHYAALVTIAFGLLLRSLLEVNDSFGGPQGMKIPGLSLFGFNFNGVRARPGGRLVLFALRRSRDRPVRRHDEAGAQGRTFLGGRRLDTIRTDEIAASVFGLTIARWKVDAFLFGNMVIGVAGALYGMMNGFVTPHGAGFGDLLLMLSIVVLAGSATCGCGRRRGGDPRDSEKLQAIQEYRLLIFSVLVLGILRFRPRACCRARCAICRASRAESGGGHGAALLRRGGLTMRFDGLVALDGLDIKVGNDETVGLVGPNGSGKSTFFNVVTGLYRPRPARCAWRI